MKSAIFLSIALTGALSTANAYSQDLPIWMAGAWERVEQNEWADEYWTPPRAGMMIGASRSGQGETLRFWEHMRIVREEDGRLAFWAIAGDNKPVRFLATHVGQEEIVFTNPLHDYPQHIRYWREGTELKAEIALVDGSRKVAFRFGPMGVAKLQK